MQELLRHSSLRSTLDVYTQAITPSKYAAQNTVMSIVLSAQGIQSAAKLAAKWLAEINDKKGTKRTQIYVLLHPLRFPAIPENSFGRNGGDDGTRTRGLCRDSDQSGRN